MVGLGAIVRDGEEHFSPEGSRRTLMMQSLKQVGLSKKFKNSKVNQSVDVTGNPFFERDANSSINFGRMMGGNDAERGNFLPSISKRRLNDSI